MLREYKIEDIDPVGDLKNKVLQILEIFKHSMVSQEYTIVLFFLSLQKEGYLESLHASLPENLNKDFNALIININGDTAVLYQALYDVYQPSIGAIDQDAFYQIVSKLRNLNQSVLKEHFELIFEDLFYLLSRSKGKFSGETLMPMELCRFMCGLAELPANAKVYNPFAGLASFGVFLGDGHSYFGQELDSKTCALGALRLAACERAGTTTFSNDDSILNWPHQDEKFDLIISNPPFGMRLDKQYKSLFPDITTVEQFVIDKSIASLNESGKLVVVVPLGFLFREGSEKRTREFLVKSDLLESIISIPGGLYSNTMIRVAILVVNKVKKEKGIVKFIDASNYVTTKKKEKILNDYSLNSIVKSTWESSTVRLIANETIVSNQYNLNAERYFAQEITGNKLGEFLRRIEGIREIKSSVQQAKLVKIGNLKSDSIDFELDIEKIDDVEIPPRTNRIDTSCLLLSTRHGKLKPTYFRYTNTPIYLSDGIVPVVIDESKIDLEYLINELNSDYVSSQLDSFSSGTIISAIKIDDLFNIKIKVLNLKEQKAKVEGIKEAYIENKKKELALQQELLGVKDESFREFASIKHTFRQYLNALKSNVSGTRLFVLNNQENGITLETIYSKNLNKTFGEHLLGLEGTINSMSKLLTAFESSTKENIVKEHDLIDLVEEAQNRFKKPELFQFEKVFFDKDSFAADFGDDYSLRAPTIEIDEDDFYRIFSNIVSNAIDHGFKEPGKKYFIRTAISYDLEDDMCLLEIANSGKAMPQDFTLKHLITRGEKTTDSTGTGMGGSDIYTILKKYNGSFEIINDQTEEFPVTYIVKFPLYTVTL